MTATYEISILEDNFERRQAMTARMQDRFPQYPLRFFHVPAQMIHHLQHNLQCTLLISLDHDLDLLPGADHAMIDPGTGMEVADWLQLQSPTCPVIIHSTNLSAAKQMTAKLRRTGWTISRITPYDDLVWVDAEWTSQARKFLLDAATTPKSDQPSELPASHMIVT